jgi:hypothetical protein
VHVGGDGRDLGQMPCELRRAERLTCTFVIPGCIPAVRATVGATPFTTRLSAQIWPREAEHQQVRAPEVTNCWIVAQLGKYSASPGRMRTWPMTGREPAGSYSASIASSPGCRSRRRPDAASFPHSSDCLTGQAWGRSGITYASFEFHITWGKGNGNRTIAGYAH